MPPQNRSKVPVGSILEGKFRVTKEIGRGGMAAVYEAENIDIGKRVAVKILAAELITSRVVRERFIREARAAAAIRSPNICDVYDSGMYEDRPFLVMELLEGESLYDLLTRVRRLSPELTIKITTHTARGLAKAHEASVIHRDLKPENIFLTKSEDGETIAKILDFGLAKFYEPTGGDAAQARLTREGALFGTPAYMSPEQAKGQGEVDHRCDLWALGCIVYECLTGQTVWNVDQGVAMILAQIAGAPVPRPSKTRPDLPPSFDAWFARALDRDPARRFQTAREFADTLAEALLGNSSQLRSGTRQSVPSHVVDSLDALLPPREVSPPAVPQPVFVATPPTAVPAPIPPIPISEPPPPKRSTVGRAIALLLGAAAVTMGGYATWLYVVHPTNAAFDSPKPDESAKAGKPRAAFSEQIAKAQESLSSGKGETALALFRDAYRTAGSGVARTLMSHAGVALEENTGRCKTVGLGRPRPFEVVDPASRPSIVLSSKGPVVSWVDTHQDVKRRQAFTALLDGSLRRVSEPLLVTPEASSARLPQLKRAGDKLAFVYWEGAGNEPGVYVRLLQADGRIAGPAHRVSAVKKNEFYPTLARSADGTFWATWTESLSPGTEDIMLRRLNSELKPVGQVVRLTAFAGSAQRPVLATKPELSITDAAIHVIFVLEQAGQRSIMVLRVASNDPNLERGVTPSKKAESHSVGTLKPISRSSGKYDQPSLSCTSAGCYAAWDDETNGGVAAFLDAQSLDPLWQRQFGTKGAHPTLAGSGAEHAIAYYDASRLKLARINKDGLEPASILAKVSGFQPYPALEPGSSSGQWYVSWRDYEAGHLEAFVVRAQCQ